MCSYDEKESQCLNGGQCSSTNTCICASACFVGNFCQTEYNALRLPLIGAIVQDTSSSQNTYIIIFLLFGLIGLINNLLALTTFMRERIRISAYGLYLILFSILSIGLMITIFTYIVKIAGHDYHSYQIASCHVIPFISLIMADGGALCTVAIAVERVFIECFNFDIRGSRIRSSFVSLFIIIYVTASNIDEIFIRRITQDLLGRNICTYGFDNYPIWRKFDIIFSYTHFLIPCLAHLICSICVLTTIARRKIFVGISDKRFCHEWIKQLYSHRDFFIPPVCLVVCFIPHGLLGHLLSICIPYSNISMLRLHISFVLLLFVPQMLTFILYVYPNEICWKEFKRTFWYRKLGCYQYYRRKKRLQQQQAMSLLHQQRKMTVSTITHELFICQSEQNSSLRS